MKLTPLSKTVMTALLLAALSACGDEVKVTNAGPVDAGSAPVAEHSADAEQIALTVYKSPSCGCCGQWIEHVQQQGFTATVNHPDDLNAIKSRYHIAPSLQSCHTAVTKEGYVFEGHVPARYMRQFLKSPPQGAIGLSVPGMPLGSPGMEMNNRFMPYQVLLLKTDGSTEVYASVETSEQQ